MKTNNPHIPDGIWPVMLTPFLAEQGGIDWPAYDKLVDFYEQNGAAGLFATCGSSEAGALSFEETGALIRAAIARLGGRLPVVAGTLAARGVDSTVELIHLIHGLGAEAAVISPNLLVGPDESEAILQQRIEEIMAATPGIALGLYECPQPYHRKLTPEFLGWTARTERFVFFKDTCCDIEQIRGKLAAIKGSPLKLFNAHLLTLLDSFLLGAHGYSGIGANYDPAAYLRLWNSAPADPSTARQLHELLCQVNDRLCRGRCYPRSAKVALSIRGVPIQPYCRCLAEPLSDADVADIKTALAVLAA